MNELLNLLHVVRKLEAIFLPLFPRKWRTPPPSYRMFSPLFQYLSRNRERYPWAEALSEWLERIYLLPYHKGGLAVDELSPHAMRYVRCIMAVIGAIIVIAVTRSPQGLSHWVYTCILLAICGLAFYGAMQISISALWLAWGMLYVPLSYYMMGAVARWAALVPGICGLAWHAAMLNDTRRWRWFDAVATLPTLFFWVEPVSSSLLDKWAIWQRSLACVVLWALVWVVLRRAKLSSFVSRSLQFFWPASSVGLFIWASFRLGKRLGRLGQPGMWLMLVSLALILCVAMGLLSRRIGAWSFLRRGSTVAVVMLLCGVLLVAAGVDEKAKGVLSNEIKYLFDHGWPAWFFIGASTMMAARLLALTNLQLFQALLPRWILPAAVWVVLAWAVWQDKFSTGVFEVTLAQGIVVSVLFGLGTTWFALRKKERMLEEWLFWGVFCYFLLRMYWKEAQGVANVSPATGVWTTFVVLCAWGLWLSYSVLCKHMGQLRGKVSEYGAVALMGAFLLLVMAGLWLSFVDGGFSVRTELTLNLFLGFTFLGIPRILFSLAAQSRRASEQPFRIPWEWVVVSGVVVIQLLQGAEHYAAGFVAYPSLDSLDENLKEALNSGKIEFAAPALVSGKVWATCWRVGRWLAAMVVLTVAIVRRGRAYWSPFSLKIAVVLTSFAVSIAEMRWIDWPTLPYTWAVVLRPWKAVTVMWDGAFFRTSAISAGLGLLWGWLLCLLWHRGGDAAKETFQANNHRAEQVRI